MPSISVSSSNSAGVHLKITPSTVAPSTTRMRNILPATLWTRHSPHCFTTVVCGRESAKAWSRASRMESGAPRQFGHLAMHRVGGVDAPHLQPGAVVPEGGMDPAARFARREHVGHRWEVDEMDATLVLRHLPVMGVAEHIRFHLAARPDDLEELRGVFHARHAARLVGVVMDDHD